MSLDVYLKSATPAPTTESRNAIYIREDGQMREISIAEWIERNPDSLPVTCEVDDNAYTYRANITHNLTEMAEEAGIYLELWRPDENNITHARQLIEPLRAGIERLKSDPDRYKAFNPSNGWGTYEYLILFTENYLAACEANPDAEVSVWR